MIRFEKIACWIGILCGLAYGVASPWLLRDWDRTNWNDLVAQLGASPQIAGLVMIVCLVASLATGHFMIKASCSQPSLIRLLIKTFFCFVPSAGAGQLVMFLFDIVGMLNFRYPLPLAVVALGWIGAGAAALSAMKGRPEYWWPVMSADSA